jgi:prepilin-type N-terminal cleavage/methylation domain-containing protein
MSTAHYTARRGFTMIELLVVIAIIIFLTVLGYYLLPPLTGNFNRVRAADAISEYLLTAKMRAKRDGLPTGIRLLPVGSTLMTQIAFVQQPDPVTGVTMGAALTLIAGGTATFGTGGDWIGAGVTAGDPDSPVQPGDYLEAAGGGSVYKITAVNPPTATGITLTLQNTAASFTPAAPTFNFNWRIYRQPRLLPGEDVKQLPTDMVIDLTAGKSVNVPLRTVTASTTYAEIVFSPSGSVVGTGTSGGKIILWISDNTTTSTPGPPTLLVINGRTGFIAAYEVNQPNNPAADHYLFTEDGRAGGL